jgi:hypothetical protein
MWTLRSAAHHVAPAIICLISTLIVGGAHAQTAADATERVKVLQIREASATNESSVKKSKTAATPAKKKVVQRKTTGQTKAAANEGARSPEAQLPNPNTPVQSAMAAGAPATPAPNDTLTLSAEQTGTLAGGDRALALASSAVDDNNFGLSGANYVENRENRSASALASGNRAIPDAEQTPGTQMAARQVPSNGSSRLSQALATLSGAMVAAAMGWYLVSSSRRRISLGVGT